MKITKKRFREALKKAWEKGAEAGWQSTGEGHNAEYTWKGGTHDGRITFSEANPKVENPYEE